MSWPLVRLSDFCYTTSGGTPSRTNDAFYDGDIPWVKSGDLRENVIIKTSEYITELAIQKSSAKLIPAGAILLAMYGATVGRMAILGVEAATNQAVCSIIPDPERAFLKYVYYALLHKVPEFLQNAVGGAQPNISQGIIKDTQIPLPPLEEQKRIAAILDKADAIRQKRQKAIELADEFLRSVFLDMFGDPVTNPKGWEERELNLIADIRSGVTKGKKIDLDKAVSVPYMRVANVQDGYLDLTTIQEILVSQNDADKFKLCSGDILLTEGGDPDKLGRGHIWSDEVPNCIHQNHIFSVRINDRSLIIPEFLSALIASQRGKRYFLKVGKQTTGIATINKTVLSEFMSLIPPIDLQNAYLKVLMKHNDCKLKLIKMMNEQSSLFSSLSQQAFSGEL